jgi:iron(III) transport system permease protein
MTTVAAILHRPRGLGVDWSTPSFVILALVLATLVILPMAWVLYYAFTDAAGSFTLANVITLANDRSFVTPFITTMGIATAVAIFACLVALPLAWLVAVTDMPCGWLIRALTLASFVTPPFLGAVAWEMLAAPNSGLLNVVARWLFDLEPGVRILNIYSVTGVIFVMTTYAFPYAFVLLANSFERIPADLEHASAMLGASRWRTMRRITVPMVMPALLAGALTAFLHAMTQFGTPAILALPANFHVVTTKIWSYFSYPPKPNLAAAAAVPILMLTILALWLQMRVLGEKGFTVIGGKSGAERRVKLGRWKWPAVGLAMLIVAAPVILPNLIIVKAAFSRLYSGPLSLENFSLNHFRFVFFGFTQTELVLKNTLLTAVISAFAGTVLALAVAYMTARRVMRGVAALGFLASAPLAVPGIVLGVGLFLAYVRPPFQLYGTIWILVLAFVTIELPAAYQQMQAAFSGLHQEMEEASRILGASRLRSIWNITVPLLATSIAATWCFIFIGAIRELSATILLTTAQTKLVSVLIFDLNESGNLGAISVLGLILMTITFVIVTFANRIPKLGRSRQ